jgi:hypothetical protein
MDHEKRRRLVSCRYRQSVPIQQALDMIKALAAARISQQVRALQRFRHMGLTDEVLQEARAFIATLAKGSDGFGRAVSTAPYQKSRAISRLENPLISVQPDASRCPMRHRVRVAARYFN